MKQLWEKINLKVNAMSIRERVLVFATLVVLVVSLINTLLLEPMFARQKLLLSQLAQQQQTMREVQSRIAAVLQVNAPNSNSPLALQINRFRQEIKEGNDFLNSSREKLVPPEEMAEHLRHLLNRNVRLQLVAMQTLPVTPLIDKSNIKSADQARSASAELPADVLDKQVLKHGVTLTLRGNYLDLLQYLKALERLPQQMYWAKAQMTVVQYPTAELTLTLYTLSLDKIWLQV